MRYVALACDCLGGRRFGEAHASRTADKIPCAVAHSAFVYGECETFFCQDRHIGKQWKVVCARPHMCIIHKLIR